jgi:hypothetical protein
MAVAGHIYFYLNNSDYTAPYGKGKRSRYSEHRGWKSPRANRSNDLPQSGIKPGYSTCDQLLYQQSYIGSVSVNKFFKCGQEMKLNLISAIDLSDIMLGLLISNVTKHSCHVHVTASVTCYAFRYSSYSYGYSYCIYKYRRMLGTSASQTEASGS